MTPWRAYRVVVWSLAAWCSVAWFSTKPVPEPECYVSAVWTRPGWDYGKVVCFDDDPDAWPTVRDQRPGPQVISLPGADEALLEADAGTVAALAVAEDPGAVEAVAWVVLNRAREGRKTVLEVVGARRQFGTTRGGRWRASWPRSSTWRRRHAELIQDAIRRARPVLEGRIADPTGGSTCFHRSGTWTPPWAPHARSWRRFGSHWFYRPKRTS